jgi:ribonuclease P protein component
MNTLTKSLAPLKGYNSYKVIIEQGSKVRTRNFIGFFVKGIDTTKTKFGIAVPKRYAKKAVVRNRTKRLVRESLIHLVQNDINKVLAFEKFIIIRTEKLPPHPKLIQLSEIEPEINKLFERALEAVNK